MKRVRVSPGKFVTISAELAEKAARVFGTGVTRDQVRVFKAAEPRHATLFAGSTKPLALPRPKTVGATAIKEASPHAPMPPSSQNWKTLVGKK